MPTICEPGSDVRSRVRFQEPPMAEPEATDSAVSQSSSTASQRFELQEDPSFWKDHNVQVVIRIRPLSSTEISVQGHNRCVRQESCQTVTWTGHPENRFTFDLVADEHVSQEKLFKVAGVPMVENCVAGYNSCMFAYGQTGSGKTHTMLGDIEEGTRRHNVNCGMTPRVFEYMFSRIQKEKESRRDEKLQFTCRCSFLEIYNEQILDLLDPSSANLQLREDAKKGVHVENLTEFEVSSARDVMQQLIQGSANRKVAATNMNRASSRSHSVFTCVIESKWESQGVTHHRFSRLNLVDLAGSERQKSSGAEGDRLKEATNINKSLSTLGLVIMNLVGISNKKSLHVPYRDSKLTFLLQDSLGGNSKTIIIANISPSNCCALETLSTLKFAQRAKYIRNNAIINEDASGDVLAMRLQIQQLKKEVNRLQGLSVGGTENSGSDGLTSYIPGSPGSFKWEGLQGSLSPLTFDKRLSQRKEYEAALVTAFRRDQDKVAALKALAAEKHAAELLATQRTEEVRSLKMRLRFREEGIKRLEAVNRGKLSVETHLLLEKEELLREIEALRNQVDRNPEVTRFAMENLHLKEELRRLQSFVEEGERDMLSEQITVLQDKLLEALDWKLMHEKDAEVAKDRLPLAWDSSANEENEFLQLQAIQHQREVEALRKNLTFCLEAKEKLERRVDELVLQLEDQRKSNNSNKETLNSKSSDPIPSETHEQPDDQMELKTMVDAIAAASQREAEAHETAIVLAKENEDMRRKMKVLIDDNNKLIELYEAAVDCRSSNPADSLLEINNTEDEDSKSEDNVRDGNETSNYVNDLKDTKYVEYLQHQLNDLHEENEKLLGLYEKAMQERDDYKRRLSNDFNSAENEEGIKCEVNHYQLKDEAIAQKKDDESLEDLLTLYHKVVKERDECRRILSSYGLNEAEDIEETRCMSKLVHDKDAKMTRVQDEKKLGEVSEETMSFVMTKLKLVQDKLSMTRSAVEYFELLEKAAFEIDEILEKVGNLDQSVQRKQQEMATLRDILPKTQFRKNVAQSKFLALKTALQSISSQNHFWDKREEQARARVASCATLLEQKNEELRNLQIHKDEVDAACRRARQSESEMRNRINYLKIKLQGAEAQKKESERVLFAIDNKPDLFSQRSMNLGKASEMLKSEEARFEVSIEMKRHREQLAVLQKEIADCVKKSEILDAMIQNLKSGIKGELLSMQEAELRLQDIILERETLLNVREDGMTTEFTDVLVAYQECIFESLMKEEEIKLCEDSVKLDTRRLAELREKKILVAQNLNNLLEERKSILMLSYSDDNMQYVSHKVEEDLGDIQKSLWEAISCF